MVRSSAVGEDSADHSFAGQLSSFLCSCTVKEVVQHIVLCWDSYTQARVASYAHLANQPLQGMGVVVQELIDPEYAGVIFTRSHLQPNRMLVEYVHGHGEQLVSGMINPKRFHFHPDYGSEDVDFLPVLAEGLRVASAIEQFYSFPVDIEWAYQHGKFYVVQSRPITTPIAKPPVYWSNTNVNENYPDPLSPLLYSIARNSYYHYFKNLAHLFQLNPQDIRRLEGEFSNIIGAFGGRMYYNMSSIHSILSASPFSSLLMSSFDHFVGYTDGQKSSSGPSAWKKKWKFIREAWAHNRALDERVQEFESLVDDYRKVNAEAIVEWDFRNQFHAFIEIRMHSWYRASLADFFAMAWHGLLGKFCQLYYPENAVGIQNKLIQAIPNLISSQPVVDLFLISEQMVLDYNSTDFILDFSPAEAWQKNNEHPEKKSHQLIKNYLHQWGFRCSGELMLTHRNYIENPVQFMALLQQYMRTKPVDPRIKMDEKHREATAALASFKKTIGMKNGWRWMKTAIHRGILNVLVNQACKGIAYRERVRLKQSLLYFEFKSNLEKLEKTWIKRGLVQQQGDVLFMTYPEIIEHLESSTLLPNTTMEMISLRKKSWEEEGKKSYPDDFYTPHGEWQTPEQVQKKASGSLEPGHLQGLCACGGKITAPVKILETVMEAEKIKPGDILVTRQTDPGWITVFPLISGLIVERGGMLSHGAIVSREFGIPAVVGVDQATNLLQDGMIITLHADQGKIVIHESH
jgi:pyruvate,water dikinase